LVEMKKLCILLDPNKKEIQNVFRACCQLKKELDKKLFKKLEFWVGCSTSSGNEVKKWLDLLKKEGIGPRYIFPGKVSHLIGYFSADAVLVPIPINWSKANAYIENLIGRAITKLLFLKSIPFGYFVLGPSSSVGKKLGAKSLGDKNVVESTVNFLKNNSNIYAIYLEQGSGYHKHIKESLIRDVRSKMKNKCHLIVGGGIRAPKEVKKIFRAGADKVVVGTALEKKKSSDIVRLMKSFAYTLR